MLRFLVPMVLGGLLMLCSGALQMSPIFTSAAWPSSFLLQEGLESELVTLAGSTLATERDDDPCDGIGPAIEPNGLV